ncbi:Ribosome biogenesis protein NOP53 [Mycena kentingensis (nom. inval.)]|nr:Ribosome biogenesis protein NOP53 [Mycena kentingensis (nom. inval.)]
MPSSTAPKAKTTRSAIGAPSQHNQSSRKGKKAWRKNVDIQEVEAGMEELRKEERATGAYLHKQGDEKLFVVDTKGDEKIQHILPKKFSSLELTSTRILKERSAVPALFSRPSSGTTTAQKRKAHLSAEEKDRLLRISKRPRKGPFNAVVDPTEFGAGSASLELSEAVLASGAYDPWVAAGAVPEEEEVKDGLEKAKPKKVKAPKHTHPKDAIEIPAIAQPHEGTSYNPRIDAHQELLRTAVDIEEKREKEAELLAAEKAKFERAKENAVEDAIGVPAGMRVDVPAEGADDEDDGATEAIPKEMPGRKTKAQRNKAARLLAEMIFASSAKKANQTLSTRASTLALRQAALKAKLKSGLAGKKLGKHRVPVGEVDVQLGEDLSESLRGLKPEGNLFRDRFTSLQQRALIEPRVPVLPKRRKTRIVEYEKHAYKRFDREQ